MFTREVEFVYENVVYWRKNIFKIPSGAAGKNVIRECTRLIKAWTSKSALKNIAWKCFMLMPQLLLQKPSKTSKSKDHSEALKRRLLDWQKGNIMNIFDECTTIQKRIKKNSSANSIEAMLKKFAILMKQGNANGAVKLLTENMAGGILPLNDETMTLLQTKHPDPK